METKRKPKDRHDSRRIVRRCEGPDLVYYAGRADSGMWDAHWQSQDLTSVYEQFREGYLGYFEDLFVPHLPESGPIVEAGCGMGQLVLALRRRGYDCIGVDWATGIIRKAHAVEPNLPLLPGDVLQLPFADNSLSGYISIGVMEHRREGPEPFLVEARRVIRPDGVLLISVPYFSPLRRFKARLHRYPEDPAGLEFYQYAFTARRFRRHLEACGLRAVKVFGYDLFYGLFDELPGLEHQLEKRRGGWRLRQFLLNSPFCRRWLGHMAMFVCRKGS